jgi:hypothetical protein
MSEGLRDDAWKGRRAFILGGGPSLKDFHPSDLAGEVTLGLNMAFLQNPTATLVYDKRLMERLSTDKSWKDYRGWKVWLNSEDTALAMDVYAETRQLREYTIDPYTHHWPSRLAEGLYRGNNAGTAGICLADVLGAEVIYLLGFDMRVEAGKPANWHDSYPEEWQAKEVTMKSYRKDIGSVARWLRAKVVNLTPGSALDVFPKDTLAHVLEKRDACKT